MSSTTSQLAPTIDGSSRHPRRRWAWLVAILLFAAIVILSAFILIPAYSIHKSRELALQAGILNAAADDPGPDGPGLVHEWDPAKPNRQQSGQNWTRGPNVYDSLNPRSIVYSIVQAGMRDGPDFRAVLVWLDAERADGFNIAYAVIKPGNRFSPAQLMHSGKYAFRGPKSQTPIRIWTATIPPGDRSRFRFEYEIGGARRVTEATLSNSRLSFKPTTAPTGQ